MFMLLLPCKTLFEWFDDAGWNELRDVAAKFGKLFDQTGAEKQMSKAGRNEYRCDLRFQAAVHQRHLELALEIGDGAQAANDRAGSHPAGEIDRQPVKGADLDSRSLAQAFADHAHPFPGAEQRLLAGILEHGDHHPVEDSGGPIDDVEMSVSQRVEAARIERGDHRYLKKVSRVVP